MQVAERALETPPEIPRARPVMLYAKVMELLTGSRRAMTCSAILEQ
jgi:hypothetical protein